MALISNIKTNFGQKLEDKKYRHRFFQTRTQMEIPLSIRELREKRNLSQAKLAQLCSMEQSAISRIENKSYSNWNLKTLWRIAEALDVRLKIELVLMEEEIKKYQDMEKSFERIETTENFDRIYHFKKSGSISEEPALIEIDQIISI